MRVTILGSGTVTPVLQRNASGLVVRAGGLRLLVDIGPGTMRRLCEAGIDAKLIDAILITHFHPDHVSDLVPFLFASNYAYGPAREEPFYLVGPEGMEQFFAGLVGVYQDWIIPRGNRLLKRSMKIDEPDVFRIGDVTILSTRSVHTDASISYRLEAEGRSVTISGDTDVSENLVELAEGTDLLICECSLPEGLKVPGHLTPSEAAGMAERAGAGKLVLTHFYPPCDETDVVAQARPHFSGEIVKAEDLAVFEP
jgi:ribonuclease BN (tRNA processing enzyme)